MLKKLKKQRAALIREAEAFRVNGEFPNDQARASFDAKMGEVEALDANIRALEQPAEENDSDEPPADAEAIRAEAVTAERARGVGIRKAVKAAKLETATVTTTDGRQVSLADDMIDRNITIDVARAEILDRLATASDATRIDNHVITHGEDARDKWIRGAMNWLFVRTGVAAMIAKHEGTTADKIDPGEFRGLSLLDLARESLTRAGQPVRGLDKMTLAGHAMAYRSNYQTLSDFATLLENALHKVLRVAYATQSDTWSMFCGIGTVSDFRAHNWYRLGALSVLDSLNEDGEFKNKSIPDAEKTTYTATTKGNIIAVSRQVIVNDDIGFVVRLTQMLGRAGKLTIEKAVYTQLLLNNGLGPTQSDAQPLFHSNRSNVNGTAAAITVASLEADRAVMRSQMDPASQEYLDLQPHCLLVPVGKRGDAITINDAQFDPADNKFQKPNTVRGLFTHVIDTPRLSGTRRYIFADPSINPVFLVSFLEGQQEPVLETENGWRIDGVEMKARLDVGVDVVDYRGAVTNAGA